MKVLTLNTHSWLEAQQKEKLEIIVERIMKADYDIIALQEVNQLSHNAVIETPENFCSLLEQTPIKQGNFAYEIVKKLKEKGVTYYWSYAMSHIGYDIYDEGSALLSKTPIDPYAVFVSIEESPDNYKSRKILFGKTTADDIELLAVSCHYSWWITQSEGFSYEWNNTINTLSHYDMPKLVMGDFNNPEGTEGYTFVINSEANIQDTYTVATKRTGSHTIEKNIAGWEDNDGKLRIDFIFSTPEFKVLRHGTVFDGKTEAIVSDHFGVEAEIVR
ncbi:endonuclease/exonuclease/phosphatase family protein [Macrococcus armenti]|uniref:endonuclease/exonuclease/phosphatase family protein n=1 Tax=Macrococcus armenti TaxID=2875764 RepID=UPI001CD00838|nr:endonuclease/exonuclease/phosphatase family protein [Macrococcus armenti]UBH11224.1 endonuclease/exonuclease/phosphatase family protein [Macrococcus armenti]UBH15701.1 endonuclease/exonuclease/phosphatase family protein [Macrococcus armenti]UBH18061.1 endonuclease/exonuclease/phosphatase family protein [Macrococcus armenti]UBH20328.1 endonuclease/exonuclease/phosphatase family protein [Macrococcus armenti]